MGGVFKRKLTRYVLGGEWEDVVEGRRKRRVLRGGKRVSKNTPGAVAFATETKEWYGYVAGRRVKLATDRDKAEKELRRRLSDAEDFRLNRFAVHRRSALAEHIKHYREHLLAQGRSPRYVVESVNRLKIVLDHCTTLEHVTADAVNASLNDLAKQGRGNLKKKKCGAGKRTRNTYLAAAKGFCQWCVKTRRLPDNPLAHVSKLRERDDPRRHDRRTLAAAELEQLITAAENSNETVRELSGTERAMLYRIALNTGYRASELASLSTQSAQLDDAPPIVIVEAQHSKRRQHEAQPISTTVAEQFRKWLANRSAQRVLFGDVDLRRDIATLLWPGSWPRHAAEMMRVDLAAAKIDYRDADGRVFDFHSLRHQYISDLAAAGVHPKTAQILARHSTIDLTMNYYTHVRLEDVVGAVESLPTIAGRDYEALRATGTDGRPAPKSKRGGQMVAVKASLKGPKQPPETAADEPQLEAEKTKKPLEIQGSEESGGHETRTRNRFPGTTFPVAQAAQQCSENSTGGEMVAVKLAAKVADSTKPPDEDPGLCQLADLLNDERIRELLTHLQSLSTDERNLVVDLATANAKAFNVPRKPR